MSGYKTKTIKTIIRKKIDKWLETIHDEELRKLCKRDTIVTGGCIASMLLGEKVNDFDVYFKNIDTVIKVAEYYLSEFKDNNPDYHGSEVEQLPDLDGKDRIRIKVNSEGILSEKPIDLDHDAGDYNSEIIDDIETPEDEIQKDDYRPVFLSSNAISLAGKVQLILRFYGNPDEIHEYFDFTHCMNYWTSSDSKLTLKPEALESLLSKTLIYNGSKYPLCSVIRSRKFIKREWSINAGQYLKMAMQISNLDLTNPSVLEEQLTGVDVAYFNIVIRLCHEKNPEKVDQTYLMEVIDRLF